MAQASGSAGRITIQPETTWGVAPITPNTIELSSSAYGESLRSSSEEIVSNAINKYGAVLATRRGQITVEGSVPFELPVNNSDIVLYGVMGSYVQEDVVIGLVTKKKKTFKRGSTLPSFLIEKGFTDIGQYFKYLGCKFNGLQLAVEPNGLVSGSFDVMGLQAEVASVSFDDTPIQYNHNPYIGIDGEVLEGGVGAKYTAFNLNITNGITDPRIIGSAYAASLTKGSVECTGDLTIMFEDLVMYNKWLADAQTDIRLTFTIGDDSVEFYFPKVKFNGEADPVLDSKDGITQTFSWRALLDLTVQSDVVITLINDFDLDAALA